MPPRRALGLAAALAITVAAPQTFAQDAPSPDCANAMTQTDMNLCAARAADAADATLNTLYQKIRARLKGDDPTIALLTATQRAWIAFRDAECDFASSSVAGGSVHPMIRAGCIETLTLARSEDFRQYLACEEGDLSCPLPPR